MANDTIFKLVVGTTDLTGHLEALIIHLDESLGNGEVPELLPAQLLKLRLCRWRDAVSRAQRTENSQFITSDNGKAFEGSLNIMQSMLRTEPLPLGVSSNSNAGAHWLIKTAQWLSNSHRGPFKESSPSNSETAGKVPDYVLAAIASLMGGLEIEGVREKLAELREEDARFFCGHAQASEHDIGLLKEKAKLVDPALAELLSFGGHTFHRIKIDENATAALGDVITSDYRGPLSPSRNLYTGVSVSGAARATMGTTHGSNHLLASSTRGELAAANQNRQG